MRITVLKKSDLTCISKKKYLTGYWENGKKTIRENLLGEKLWFIAFKGKKYSHLYFIPPFWFTVFLVVSVIIASVDFVLNKHIGSVIAFSVFIFVSTLLLKSIVDDCISFKKWLNTVTEQM